jgi:hypothetical protein
VLRPCCGLRPSRLEVPIVRPEGPAPLPLLDRALGTNRLSPQASADRGAQLLVERAGAGWWVCEARSGWWCDGEGASPGVDLSDNTTRRER